MTALEHAFKSDKHIGLGDWSTTELQQPLYYMWQKKKNGTIEESAEDMAQRAIGTAIHSFIEANGHDTFMIKEMYMEKEVEFDIDDSYVITGTPDWIKYEKDKWVLGDIKTKGGYSLKKFCDGETDDVIKQMSIYRWLLPSTMLVSDEALVEIVALGDIRGQKRLQRHTVQLMSRRDTEMYVRERIKLLDDEREPDMDCPAWKCKAYCDAKCVKNGKIK